MTRNIFIFVLVIALGMAAVATKAQTVYRWIDSSGRVQYSDQPPPTGAKDAQQRNVNGNSIQNNQTSLAAQEAQQRNPVTLYISECGESCDQAKAFLNKRGIPHTLVDPTRSAELNKKFREETGGNSVPTLKIGDRKLSGWSESNWASALDAGGYPKAPTTAAKTQVTIDQAGLNPDKGAQEKAAAATPPQSRLQ